jgi:hypothetical protein
MNFLQFFMNPWTIAVGSGLIILFITYFFKKPKSGFKISELKNTQTQKITINNYPNQFKSGSELFKESSISNMDVPILKAKTKILFIEDDKFKKISNLKKFGWNISQIKDLRNLDNEQVRLANIIFVDYKGVGSLVDEEGVGLIKALRNRYGDEKWLILYSAHSNFALNIFDTGANGYLAKNSTEYEMEQKIIEGAKNVIKS